MWERLQECLAFCHPTSSQPTASLGVREDKKTALHVCTVACMALACPGLLKDADGTDPLQHACKHQDLDAESLVCMFGVAFRSYSGASNPQQAVDFAFLCISMCSKSESGPLFWIQ